MGLEPGKSGIDATNHTVNACISNLLSATYQRMVTEGRERGPHPTPFLLENFLTVPLPAFRHLCCEQLAAATWPPTK